MASAVIYHVPLRDSDEKYHRNVSTFFRRLHHSATSEVIHLNSVRWLTVWNASQRLFSFVPNLQS